MISVKPKIVVPSLVFKVASLLMPNHHAAVARLVLPSLIVVDGGWRAWHLASVPIIRSLLIVTPWRLHTLRLGDEHMLSSGGGVGAMRLCIEFMLRVVRLALLCPGVPRDIFDRIIAIDTACRRLVGSSVRPTSRIQSVMNP